MLLFSAYKYFLTDLSFSFRSNLVLRFPIVLRATSARGLNFATQISPQLNFQVQFSIIYFQNGTKSIVCVSQPLSEFDGEIDLGDFISTVSDDQYYTYPGSLTTPGCQEAVIWTVFPSVITIDNDQVYFIDVLAFM